MEMTRAPDGAGLRLAVGCDEAAWQMKDAVKAHLAARGVEAYDFGTFDGAPVNYANVGIALAEAVASGQFDRGVLFCGTGIGMAISANKVRGIRAAQCHDTYSAERAQKSNNAQIITIGARVVGIEYAKMIVDTWLASHFEGGRSLDKVARIAEYEATPGPCSPP